MDKSMQTPNHDTTAINYGDIFYCASIKAVTLL